MSKSYLWVIKILSLRYQKHIWGITYISMRYHKNIWGIRIIQMRDKNHYFLSKAKNFPDLTDLREHDSLNVHVFIYSWLSHSPFRMFGCSILVIQRCWKYTTCYLWRSFESTKTIFSDVIAFKRLGNCASARLRLKLYFHNWLKLFHK